MKTRSGRVFLESMDEEDFQSFKKVHTDKIREKMMDLAVVECKKAFDDLDLVYNEYFYQCDRTREFMYSMFSSYYTLLCHFVQT